MSAALTRFPDCNRSGQLKPIHPPKALHRGRQGEPLRRTARAITTLIALCATAACSLVNAGPVAPAATAGPQSRTPGAAPALSPAPLIPTSTAPAPKSLTLCLSAEPDSLYQYRAYDSRAKHLAAEHVRQALFDGPIDMVGFEPRPVILAALPTLENGGAAIETVTVRIGERYYDAAADRVAEWREADAQLQRLVMTYTLRPGVLWSDGEPLTASDSVFAFELVAGGGADPAMQPASLLALVQRTASYVALDERTVRWIGLPGFVDRIVLATFPTFFSPLPRHQLGADDPTQMLTNADAIRRPIGWGPYVMVEWTPGESITLARNPLYFRAAEGLPRVATLTFRFVPDATAAEGNALTSGKCDAVLHDSFGRRQADLIPAIDAAAATGELVVQYAADSAWEHLDFNLSPADDRPAFFADPSVRQAVALCLDRQALADSVYPGHGVVAAGLVPPASPYFAAEAATPYAYDPSAGQAALASAGWTASGSDGKGIVEKDGVPLAVELTLQEGTAGETLAALIARELAACGVSAAPRFVSGDQLSGIGAQSPIFRREFDMALFAWRGAPDGAPQCELYASEQVPTEDNGWTGLNDTGYASPGYDLACQSAREATSPAVSRAAFGETQRLLAADLPSLPLFHRLQWLIARHDVLGLRLDGIALDDLRSELENIEELDRVQ